MGARDGSALAVQDAVGKIYVWKRTAEAGTGILGEYSRRVAGAGVADPEAAALLGGRAGRVVLSSAVKTSTPMHRHHRPCSGSGVCAAALVSLGSIEWEWEWLSGLFSHAPADELPLGFVHSL